MFLSSQNASTVEPSSEQSCRDPSAICAGEPSRATEPIQELLSQTQMVLDNELRIFNAQVAWQELLADNNDNDNPVAMTTMYDLLSMQFLYDCNTEEVNFFKKHGINSLRSAATFDYNAMIKCATQSEINNKSYCSFAFKGQVFKFQLHDVARDLFILFQNLPTDYQSSSMMITNNSEVFTKVNVKSSIERHKNSLTSLIIKPIHERKLYFALPQSGDDDMQNVTDDNIPNLQNEIGNTPHRPRRLSPQQLNTINNMTDFSPLQKERIAATLKTIPVHVNKDKL